MGAGCVRSPAISARVTRFGPDNRLCPVAGVGFSSGCALLRLAVATLLRRSGTMFSCWTHSEQEWADTTGGSQLGHVIFSPG
jgi:hypothetical protein